MKDSLKSTIALILLIALPGLAVANPAKLPSKQLIASQFERWNAALKSGDPEKVAALYCQPGGVLIPTVSNKVRTNHAEIADYFVHFLQLKPVGQIDKAYIRILGPDTAVNAGLYTFHLTKDGKPTDVHARYTFVYQKEQGQWCIMDHHSSAMPETGQAAAH